MTRQVLITISGLQYMDEETGEPVEILSMGEFHERNQTVYLRYEEPVEGSKIPIISVIKIKEDVVEVTRRGPVNTRMVFEEGKEHLTDYETPYGCLKVGILSNRVHIERSAYDIDVRILYSIKLEEEYLSDCTVGIHVKSKDAPDFSIDS